MSTELERSSVGSAQHCPNNPRWADDLTGCGTDFNAEPDWEGIVDCPNCGMWHSPAQEGGES